LGIGGGKKKANSQDSRGGKKGVGRQSPFCREREGRREGGGEENHHPDHFFNIVVGGKTTYNTGGGEKWAPATRDVNWRRGGGKKIRSIGK